MSGPLAPTQAISLFSHTLAVCRSSTPSGLTPPTRPLQWGDINVIHTTDTHGWFLGHQKISFPESNYSGDLGDLAFFVSRMKEIALQKDLDLLLIDSGDLHDGTGLWPFGTTSYTYMPIRSTCTRISHRRSMEDTSNQTSTLQLSMPTTTPLTLKRMRNSL
ncbi:hypothetical protein K435DRAFT_789690 [Dendrothele bispora CBS 962.96]|uniref:Calcineurin-like phosphoesterase domain-containing protein n=1 Tax=Dendrothele bispora (strain CBS 962.96) TaxID=1314807 RepID=A0A4V4HID9_DENBC|nr:hypothetical protein K435DRAFT_789690 [Dendrothele bispora CBS 962.96]